MSWDISVFDVPEVYQSVADLPGDFRGRVFSRAAVIAEISRLFTTANFADPTWGFVDGGDWSIEVNLGKDEETDGFMFHVRGGDGALAAVWTMLDALKLRGLDCQTGEFLSSEPAAAASFGDWRAYRDHVVEAVRRPDPTPFERFKAFFRRAKR